MIRYMPPKSQMWGHLAGRMKATDLVERGLRFLDTQCSIIPPEPSFEPTLLGMSWNSGDEFVSNIAAEIDRTLGKSRGVQVPVAEGVSFEKRNWPFQEKQLPLIAPWIDSLSPSIKRQDVFAQLLIQWAFAWRDEPTPHTFGSSAGGMFSIYLGQPQGITTIFSFPDLDKYFQIKAYLAEIGLCELADKHVRPKKIMKGHG